MISILVDRTIRLAFDRLTTLFAAGWGYMLLLVALNLAISMTLRPDGGFTTGSYITEPLTAGNGADREKALRLLAVFANIATGFSIGVAYCRKVLIDANDFFLAFGRRYIKVAIKLMLLMLIGVAFLVPLLIGAALLTMVTGPIGVLALIAAPFIALMLIQRFSLVLPAAAVDDRLTLGDSWRATAGLGLALMTGALVACALAAVGIGLWALVLWIGDALLPTSGWEAQMRSALLPMGVMIIVTWAFSNLHATAYGLVRERFARKVGLTPDDSHRAEALRAVRAAARLGRIEPH